MLIFEKIRFKNFLSYGNNWTEIELNKNDKTLIVGANGNGKSTLINALSFVLFGKSFIGGNLTNPRLINSINKKETLIELIFSNNNKKYKILRGLKPNIFEIYLNDILIPKPPETSIYQEDLEKNILNFSYEAFKQIVVLNKDSYIPFMKLSGPKRREVNENLLDLQICSKMNNILKLKISNNEDVLKELNIKLNSENDKFNILNKHIKDVELELFEKNNEKENELKHLNENNEKLILELKCLNENNEKITKQYGKIKIVEENLKILYNKQFQTEEHKKKIENNILQIKNNNICSSCNQKIPEENIKNKIEENNNELLILNEKLNELNIKIEKLIPFLENKLNIESNLNIINENIQKTQTEIYSNNKLIENLSKNVDKKDYNKEKLQKSVNIIKKQIYEYNIKKEQILKTKDLFNYAALLLKDTGIKNNIIKNYIPEFNRLINKYLEEMNFYVSFELDENFNEKIRSRHRDEFSYDSFSAGEKAKLDLAILFTWREVAKQRNSVNCNLLIFDEVLDGSLDNESVEHLMKVLNTFNDNIFVISHSENMEEYFSNVLEIKKENNFSTINFRK